MLSSMFCYINFILTFSNVIIFSTFIYSFFFTTYYPMISVSGYYKLNVLVYFVGNVSLSRIHHNTRNVTHYNIVCTSEPKVKPTKRTKLEMTPGQTDND